MGFPLEVSMTAITLAQILRGCILVPTLSSSHPARQARAAYKGRGQHGVPSGTRCTELVTAACASTAQARLTKPRNRQALSLAVCSRE